MKKSLFTYLYKQKGKFYAVQTNTRRVFEIDEKTYYILNEGKELAELDKETFKCFVEAEIIVPIHIDEVGLLEEGHKMNDNDIEWHSLHIIPTEACNFGCEYCFVLKDKQNAGYERVILDETLYKGIDFFLDNNPSDQIIVTFYGGEPLLAPEVIYKSVDYIEGVKGRKISKKIITNASRVTPRIAEFLAVNEFDVNVSLDGNKDGHDQFRLYKDGGSTYDDVLQGIKLLQKAGNSIKILMTVGDFNAKNLIEHVKSVLELKPTTIALNLPKALQTTDNQIERKMDYKQLLAAYIECMDLCYEKHIPEGHMADIIYGFLREETQYRPCHGCGKQIALSPDGLIGPCQAYLGTKKYFMPLESFEDKEHLRKTEEFEKWKQITMYKCEKCRHCYLLPVCPGDCPYDWENRTGSLLDVPETYCTSRKVMFDYMIGRLVNGKEILFRPQKA